MIAQTPYDISALQVLNAASEWISPVMEPETFVVNLGDMMGRLTNDVFQSTVHRVCNKDTRGRYSLPFFFGLSNDELISTLPQFVTEENPLQEQYKKPMTGFEHYNVRMQRAHHKHGSAVNQVDPALPFGMTKINGVLVEGM
jgi:isopenicillin N synthase-like dioxygenase